MSSTDIGGSAVASSIDKLESKLMAKINECEKSTKQQLIMIGVITSVPFFLGSILIMFFGEIYHRHQFREEPSKEPRSINRTESYNQAIQVEKRGAPAMFSHGIVNTEKMILCQNILSFLVHIVLVASVLTILLIKAKDSYQ